MDDAPPDVRRKQPPMSIGTGRLDEQRRLALGARVHSNNTGELCAMIEGILLGSEYFAGPISICARTLSSLWAWFLAL